MSAGPSQGTMKAVNFTWNLFLRLEFQLLLESCAGTRARNLARCSLRLDARPVNSF